MRIAGILLAAQQAAVHAGANHTTYSTTSHGIAGLTLLESTHGLSVDEIRSLKLDSEDLRGLGVSSAADRLAILRAAASEPDSPAATPTLRNPNATALQDFTFVVSHFNSTRQYGKCLNIIVKYRYVPGALPNATGGGYLDYRDMRDTAMQFAQPTADLPMAVQWEEITMRFNEEVLEKYENSIVALSTQIQVMSDINQEIAEPGNHGSINSVIPDEHRLTFQPLNEPWIHAFSFDCTRHTTAPTTYMPKLDYR